MLILFVKQMFGFRLLRLSPGSILKQLIPPILISAVQALIDLRSGTRFTGDYKGWENALSDSVGYHDGEILSKVLGSAIEVRDGRATFERDSVVFHHEEFVWPTLACLCDVAARNHGRLSVVDFGGSLGSFYSQHRKFLDSYDTTWSVVEQPHFVEAGRKELATDTLRFEESISDVKNEHDSRVLFLSAVLHYLPEPHRFLADICAKRWDAVIIDRTPLLEYIPTDRLTVQHVPASIYAAKYPAWFFSKARFLAAFNGHFILQSHWESLDMYKLDGKTIQTQGFYFLKKSLINPAVERLEVLS